MRDLTTMLSRHLLRDLCRFSVFYIAALSKSGEQSFTDEVIKDSMQRGAARRGGWCDCVCEAIPGVQTSSNPP
ncbi:hypothetical protein J6590_015882 [Homalodisca vitripennis]|nr:hypothetical protein J6590_015882 [Homalodisca vitripennis]